jgi:DNA-binding beta-propeller fold protein YncE
MLRLLRRLTLPAVLTLVLVFIVPAVALATPAPVFSSRWGVSGSGNGDFSSPNLIATSRSGYLFVADSGNNRIQRFTSAGVYESQWNNNGDTGMSFPYGVATDRLGYVYVTEAGNQRVDKYDFNGVHHLPKFGLGGGVGPGQFGTPFGIAVDPWGFVYVGDYSLNRVQKFAPDGTYMSQLAATGVGALNGPSGLAIDPLGNVFVADTFNHRIVEFGPTGLFVRAFGSLGTAAGQLNTPRGLAFAPDGNLLVTEQQNAPSRVSAFSPSGAYQYKFGFGGSAGQNLFGAFGLATDGTGIFVGDIGDYSMKKFTFGAAKPVARISGKNRYALAASVAAARWPRYRGMKHVIIVNGEDSAAANALAVSPLAGVYDAPILLTKKAALSADTNTALKAMRAASGKLTIHVIGDTRLISRATYNKIKADNRLGSVERISGHDPYTLSIAIAKRVKSVKDSRGLPTDFVFLFNAQKPAGYLDALLAGAGAARSGVPMLAVKNSSVPTAVNKTLATTFAGKAKVSVSSSTYLSDAVLLQAGGVARLSQHADRAGSGADIALLSRAWYFTSFDSVGAVSTFPAALVAGPYQGLQDGALIYTRKTVWPGANTVLFGSGLAKSGFMRGVVIGSTSDITNTTKSRFSADLNTP